MHRTGLWPLVILCFALPAMAAGTRAKKKAAPPSKPTPTATAKPDSPKAVEGAVPAGSVPATSQAEASSAPAPKGPTRIDFDDRLVEGQTNKSGAVYLYDRKDLQVDSMVKQPSTYREEIAKGLLQ